MNFGPTLCGGILTLMACLGAAAPPVSAAQFHVTIGRDGTSASPAMTVPIELTAEVAIGAAQLELIYDPARLRWLGGEAGPLTANSLVDANPLTPGRVKIAFAGGDNITGKGVMYHAKFEWIGTDPGATSLRFDHVRAWDQGSGLELTSSSTPGEVAPAQSATTPQAGPEPAKAAPAAPNYFLYAGLAGFVLLIVAGLIILRKKSSQ